MVYLFGRDKLTVLLTQLTQRMSRSVPVADAFPSSAVSSADSGIAVVFFVAFCFFLGVFLAEPSVSQLGTAGVGAGTLGFLGHRFSFKNDKSHRRISPGSSPKINRQHKKAPRSKSSNKLASEFNRCQFCFELNTLKIVKLNIPINDNIGFLKST